MATYDVYTLADLQAITPTHLADDCILHNDIDATATNTWNVTSFVAAGFVPIGGNSVNFTGTFDGGGYTIKNLYIYRPTTDLVGLFGTITKAAGYIKNLTLLNINITGRSIVGGITGASTGPTALVFSNLSVSGVIDGAGNQIGGLVGQANTSQFIDCSTAVEITHSSTVSGTATSIGGFVGSASSLFTRCTSSGNITLAYSAGTLAVAVGGFVGLATTLLATTSCSATGNVSVNITTSHADGINAGGFVGEILTGSTTISKCFAYGDVESLSTTLAYVGGFIGYQASAEVITQCGAEGNTTNNSSSTSYTGGFVGYHNGAGAISNCYAMGSVCDNGIGVSTASIGGFAGSVANTRTIATSYSVGHVFSPATNGGGFCGTVGTTVTFTNCFFDNQTSGWSTSATPATGSSTGETTVAMKTVATFTGWSFATIWDISTFTRSPGTGITAWLSHTSDYENFEEGVKDADSFSVTVPTTNMIRWIEGIEVLLLGTSGDEWKMASNRLDTPLTPTNFGIKKQSSFGSANIQPLKVNETALFVDFVGRKIRELVYDDNKAKYTAPDMTALAENVTIGGITCLAYQRNPDSIIWVVVNGQLKSMTYDREQNVVAWCNHPMNIHPDEIVTYEGDTVYYEGSEVLVLGNNPVVMSVCVIPGETEDEVWLSIGRHINGTDVTYIERFMPRNYGTSTNALQDAFFVDSGLTYSGLPTNTLTAAHLKGETVSVLGTFENVVTVYEDLVVSSAGVITLPNSAMVVKAQYGLPYTSKLQPMKIVIPNRQGSNRSALSKISELGVSLLDSSNVQYGRTDAELYPIDLTRVEWVNSSDKDGLYSGDVVVPLSAGYDRDERLVIVSDSPTPLTVRAIIVRTEVSGR